MSGTVFRFLGTLAAEADRMRSMDADGLIRLMQARHSARSQFSAQRPVTDAELMQILEAARWAPTAHNMQNFEIVVVSDRSVLNAIGRIRSEISEVFLRENYEQMSFSEEELARRGTGVLASMFPPAWRRPDAKPSDAEDLDHAFLGGTLRDAPVLLVVTYDSRKRAPASEGDGLGLMGLGCVMENMWLAAAALGISMQVLSVFGAANVEGELREILRLPDHLKIAFACRLGHPLSAPQRYLRVRRPIESFAYRDAYGRRLWSD